MSKFTEFVESYAKHFPILVYPTKGKKPVTNNWQNLSREELLEIAHKAKGNNNLGVRLDNHLVIDVDCPQLARFFYDPLHIADIPQDTPIVFRGNRKTGDIYHLQERGHIYFVSSPRIPKTIEITLALCQKNPSILPKEFWEVAKGMKDTTTILEFRTSNGQQMVVPPSIHPDGSTYQWHNGQNIPNLKTIPTTVEDAILELVKNLDKPETQTQIKTKHDDDSWLDSRLRTMTNDALCIAIGVSGKTRTRSGGDTSFCCPFHEEKNPSAWIEPNSNGVPIFHCRVCSETGLSPIQAVGKAEKISDYMSPKGDDFKRICQKLFGEIPPTFCKNCGVECSWKETETGWKLFEGDIMHKCEKKYITCQKCGVLCLWDVKRKQKIDSDGEIHRCTKKNLAEEPKTQNPPMEIELSQEDKDPLTRPEKSQDVELKTSWIHPVFGEYWQQYEGETEACQEYVLTSLLVAVGAILGNKVTLKIGRGIRPNLYAVLIGDSTFMKKTTSMDLGLSPLYRIARAKMDKYDKEFDEYEQKLEEYESLNKKDRLNVPKPKEPIDLSPIYPNEFSPEALLEKMAGKPDGLFAYSEMGKLLAMMESGYMQGFKERLTEFYDGGNNLPYIRKIKTAKRVRIENPCPSIVGCSTFQWLQAHLKEQDLLSGFLARFVFVVKRNYPDIDVAIPPYFQTQQKWIDLFLNLEAVKGEFCMSEASQKIYSDWYSQFKHDAIKEDKLLHSFLARLTDTCHKIAIINHCLNIVTGQCKNPSVIEADSYDKAFVWVEFFARNIMASYQELTAGPNLQELKIMEIIRKRGIAKNGLVIISQSNLTKYSNMKLKELLEVMELLEMKKNVQKIVNGNYTFYRILE